MKKEGGHLSKLWVVGNGQALLFCWTVFIYPWCMCTCQPKVITIATAIFYTLLTINGPTFIEANTTLQRVMCSCWHAWYGSEHVGCKQLLHHLQEDDHFFPWLQTILHSYIHILFWCTEVLYVDVHLMILHVLKLFDSRIWGSPTRLASSLGPKGSGNFQ